MAFYEKEEGNLFIRVFILILGAYAYATEMNHVFAGSGVTIYGTDLKYTYKNTQKVYWYPEKTASNGIYCAAVVETNFVKGLFSSYDTCKVVNPPVNGICCMAGVQNMSGSTGVKYTSVVTEADGMSTEAKVKHNTNTVKFTISFGSTE